MVKKPTYEELEKRILELEKAESERKRIDEAYKESEAYLRTLIRTIPDLVWLKDTQGVYLFCNSKFERFFGAKEKDIIGKTDYDFVAKDLADFFRQHDNLTIAEGKPCKNEEEVTFADDGHREILETIKIPIYTNDGRLVGVLGIGRDITERKKSEENFKQLVDLHQTILDTVTVGLIFIKDRKTQWTNRAITKMFGYEYSELLGKNASIYYGKEEMYKKVGVEGYAQIAKGETYSIELQGKKKDGTLFWCHLTSKAINPQNLSEGSIWVAQDITERKIAEEKLRESERNYRDVFNAANDAIVIYDMRGGNIVDVNHAMLKICGFSTREEALLAKIDFFVPDIYPYTMENALEKLRLTEEVGPQVFEWRIRNRPSQKLLWVEVSMIKSNLSGKNRIIASVRDITERKEAEEKIKQLASLHQTILDTVTVGLVFIKDRKTQWTNSVWAKMFGYAPAEIIGKETSIYYATEEIYKKVGSEGYAKLAKGETYTTELQGKRKDGSLFWCSLVGKAINPHTLSEGSIWMAQDITERKKLEDQLSQIQRIESIGRLAGGVAHDFNNMLGIIIGCTGMALQDVSSDQPLYGYLQDIMKAAEKSADLTHQLLAFARKQPIAPKTLDLNETLAGMLKMLRSLIGENIELIWKPAQEVWPIRMDPSQLDQILTNLCVNARDAITDVGKITIETGNATIDEAYCSYNPESIPGDYVILSVSDNGCGMDKKIMDKLFEPFFTTKGIGKGTGLGLATVYGNIKQNNGFINVYSEPGVGTTFKIFLPRQISTPEPVLQESHTLPVVQGHETILLVEDEPAILAMASLMLKKFGYQVLAVSKPDTAIRIAKERKGEIHLLITDVIMPGMNGRILAKNITSIYPGIKCLFMSGYTNDVIAHHGVLDEGVHFIQKPFSMQALARKILEVLSGK